MVGLILELKAVVSDSPVERVLDVAAIVADARVERAGAMGLDPGGKSEAVVERQHLDGQVVVLAVEVKSSVIKGVRIILLDRELACTSEELDDPVVACAVSVLLEYL